MGKWVRPEVYPLFAAVGMVGVIGCFSMARHVYINPEVRINKENRMTSVLENHEEGEQYAEHSLRKYVRGRRPEVFLSLNSFFSDPK